MTEYISKVEDGSKPRLVKKFTASSGETFTAEIGLGVKDEIDIISTEIIYSHLRNLIQYIKSCVESISVTEKDDNSPEAWPIKGWSDVEKAKLEILDWWEIAYYRDEPEEEPSDV
jgi:hypothetical protein